MQTETLLIGTFVFILGTALGSFGNVIIYRFRSGRSLGGRSRCLSCGRKLGPLELIPILSYCIARGKCRKCGSRFSVQYPLVELAAGLLALAVFRVSCAQSPGLSPEAGTLVLGSWVVFALDLAFWETLLVIAVYDLRHKIIPDSFALLLATLGLTRALLAIIGPAYGVVVPAFDNSAVSEGWWNPWWNLAAAPTLAFPFAALWFLSGGRWIGLGDAKLACGLGLAFGIAVGTTGIVLGFWIGAIVSITLLLTARLLHSRTRITMKSELPFAPFLALGALVAYLFDLNIANWTF